MKRPHKCNAGPATSHQGGRWFAAASFCGLFAVVVGCTGKLGGATQSGAGGGGASNPGGATGTR
jgi:hypothetical protein